MKKIYTIIAAILVSATLWAQVPEKISYQAVVRDANNNLITNQTIGMQISILQSDEMGEPIYVETQIPVTNNNGLISIEIGTGEIVSGDFLSIDWAYGPFYIQTEIDIEGGSNYTIVGTSPLLSVPYAFHARTAEYFTGEFNETDPIFASSPSANITEDDLTNLDNLSGINTGDQDISGIEINTLAIQDTASQIRADIPDVSGFLTSETDPTFTSSQASNITESDITNLGNLSGTNTGDQDISGIATNVQAIQDTASQIRADIPDVPTGTQTGQMQYWNGAAWVTVPAGNEGATLQMIGGVPTWTGGTSSTPNVTNPATGETWMDRNLGASQAATSSTDAAAYGDLYQWGRGTDGHEKRTSNTTSTQSSNDDPGHGNFIIASDETYDWRNPQNNNLWQSVNGINNPCPDGYRLPTQTEWEAEAASWSSNDPAGAFASPLKLVSAGGRSYEDGSLMDVGSAGAYWSSTVFNNLSNGMTFNSSVAGVYQYPRTFGMTVRCIKD